MKTQPAISGQELRDLRLVGLLTPIDAAALCGVHPKTWHRYETGQTRIPWAIYQLLKIQVMGSLPAAAGPAWDGWRWINGRLWDPADNHWHTPGSIRAWFYVAAQLETFCSYENQAERLAEENKNVVALPVRRAHDLTRATYAHIEKDSGKDP